MNAFLLQLAIYLVVLLVLAFGILLGTALLIFL